MNKIFVLDKKYFVLDKNHFVLDKSDFVLDKKHFVRADGQGISLRIVSGLKRPITAWKKQSESEAF